LQKRKKDNGGGADSTIGYDPQRIEAKWQKRWEDERVFETDVDAAKRKYYTLEMAAYPVERCTWGTCATMRLAMSLLA